jgi:hypothetical protein
MASIKLQGDTSGELTISAPAVAGTNTLTLPASTSTLATTAQTEAIYNSLGVRNLIINGDMRIDQRATSVTSSAYTVDRWGYYGNLGSKATVAQSSIAPTGYTNSLLATSSSAYSVAATDIFVLRQYIEGFNIAHLGWGTANAKTVTLSFWVRSSLTGTFGGVLKNAAEDRCYPYSYTISTANTWEQKSITIAGDTTGTWGVGGGSGIQLAFGLGVGTTYSGTAGAWSGTSYLASATGATSVVGTSGATFYITGVQLEVGTEATPFEHRPYDMELARCQRYYFFQDQVQFIGYQPTGQLFAVMNYFPISMRASPTLTVFDYAGASGKVFLNANNVTGTIDISQKNSCRVYASTTTTGSQTFGYTFKADAEL